MRYLTVAEVAARLRVSKPTVRRAIKAGQIPTRIVSSSVRIPESYLEQR